MTSYITREEYDRLSARLDAIEKINVESKIEVTLSGEGDSNEQIKALVQRGVREGMRAFSLRQPPSTLRQRPSSTTFL